MAGKTLSLQVGDTCSESQLEKNGFTRIRTNFCLANGNSDWIGYHQSIGCEGSYMILIYDPSTAKVVNICLVNLEA